MPVLLTPQTPSGSAWNVWHARRPVFPVDDHGAVWLEGIRHRRHPRTERDEYRSFRTETAKLRELISRAF